MSIWNMEDGPLLRSSEESGTLHLGLPIISVSVASAPCGMLPNEPIALSEEG